MSELIRSSSRDNDKSFRDKYPLREKINHIANAQEAIGTMKQIQDELKFISDKFDGEKMDAWVINTLEAREEVLEMKLNMLSEMYGVDRK